MRRSGIAVAPLEALAGGAAAAAPCAPAQLSAGGAAAHGCTQHLRGPSCGSLMAVEMEQEACGSRLACTRPVQGSVAEPFGSPCLMGRSSSFSSWSSAPEVPSLAEPRLRERSATPEDADMADCSPITPTAAPSHAATSPLLAAAAATPAAAETDAAAAPAAAEAAAQRAASAAALWRRIQSFMHCVSGSPLVHSALLSLQLSGAFPAAAEEGLAAERGLEWTLSQMLSFHLKAGWAEATEHSLLASLWLLESWESVWRSPATVCLNDYLKHLALFSQEAVIAITADWKSSFRALRAGVVAAQSDLLTRLDWRVRLDVESEIKPCSRLLFQLAGEAGSKVPTLREAWAQRMHGVCGRVRQQAAMLHKHSRPAEACGGEGQGAPTKRQRTWA
ncbi:hypothetical protein COHA_005818 [Chlorella ohadii]|uniref:Uncharacterized protein n=1 Tax=Chlorella ohadii TaxID=2649997 RepID=A0AAD5DQC1_9CHLO|nr:hypothetical protein COHA_005818 [Chlorella ohadii]